MIETTEIDVWITAFKSPLALRDLLESPRSRNLFRPALLLPLGKRV